MDYTKLMKGLEMCSGPECCKDGCPYYNTTTSAMTCRARLLMDANIAITNERGRADDAEAELQDTKEALETANAEYEAEHERMGELFALNKANEEDARSVRAERDAIIADRADITRERDKLRAENESLRRVNRDLDYQLCSMQHDMLKDKTDRPSASDEALKSEYKRGYLDAMEYCFRELCKRAGGGCYHE